MDEFEKNNEYDSGSARPEEIPQPEAHEQPAQQEESPAEKGPEAASDEQPAPHSAPDGSTQAPPYAAPGYNPPPQYRDSYTQPQSPYSPYSNSNYAYGYNAQPAPPVPPKKGMGKGAKTFLVIIAAIAVIAVGTVISLFVKNDMPAVNNSSAGATQTETKKGDASLSISDVPASGSSTGKALSTSDIAARGKASNVGIVVYSGSSAGASSSAGEGSGIVMGTDASGKRTYIITCAHVISSQGIKATVQTEDGTSYDAKIVGYDTRTDIGVLSIDATGLTAAEFGNSDALTVGEPIYAVGNPGGVEFFGSFTNGYVSAIDRPISSEIGYTMKCIQHTAAINPGNSGGALLNQYGQVVGINSQKITATDYEGMGFSIPITSAKDIIDSLIAYGYVPNRPKLGITYYSVSASRTYSIIAQINSLPAGTLIINKISSDSSLSGTDARQYDMIVAVNGKELATADVLPELIDNGKVGDKLTLTLCRANSDYSVSRFDVQVTLVEDKGTTAQQEEETHYYINPFDNEYFGY